VDGSTIGPPQGGLFILRQKYFLNSSLFFKIPTRGLTFIKQGLNERDSSVGD